MTCCFHMDGLLLLSPTRSWRSRVQTTLAEARRRYPGVEVSEGGHDRRLTAHSRFIQV